MRTTHKSGQESRNGHAVGGGRVGGRFSGLAKEAMSLENDFIDEAKKRGGVILADVQDKGQKALKRSAEWIQKNPLAAVGTAFVVGIVMKAWFSGKEE